MPRPEVKPLVVLDLARRCPPALSYDGMRRIARITIGFTAALVLSATPTAAADKDDVRADARELTSPIPYSKDSIRAGRKTYLRLCQYCHGADGRAEANPDFEAPSLRVPKDWSYGSTDGEIFTSIRDGAGHEMPPFHKQLTEDQIWQLVHYIRSIGPKALRPAEQNP